MESHNCIRELRTLMGASEQKNSDLRKDLDDVKYELAEQRRDIGLLKEVIRKLRGGPELLQGTYVSRPDLLSLDESSTRDMPHAFHMN